MEVLLLTDIAGIGKKNDLIVVKSGFALNHLLPSRKALVVTPNVRKRYAEHIKKRAMERESERALVTSLTNTLAGKVVHIVAKASKANKLYAAVSAKQITDALKSEFGIEMAESSLQISEHIKAVGMHAIKVVVGAQTAEIKVEVKAEAEAPAKAA